MSFQIVTPLGDYANLKDYKHAEEEIGEAISGIYAMYFSGGPKGITVTRELYTRIV